jgi:hypothetical protein
MRRGSGEADRGLFLLVSSFYPGLVSHRRRVLLRAYAVFLRQY